MKLIVLAQGKLKDRGLRDVANDYKSRLSRYVTLEEIEVKDSQVLCRRTPTDAWLVMLEVTGEAVSSRALATRLEHWSSLKRGNICFVIGGAEGIPRDLSRAGDATLSLSSLTLPHRLVRVVLLEQLYRSMTILRGEPYARED